jgi:Fic family protein
MNDLLQKIQEKKEELAKFEPISREIVKNLDEWYKVELTYTSNAIEGNTLSKAETAMVIEKGIAVEGKTITEHLEAINHAQAYDFVRTSLLLKNRHNLVESDVLGIHKLILQKINDDYAGRYRDVAVRIAGSATIVANPMKVPELMRDYFEWLHSSTGHIAEIVAESHLRFETIHPFIDGNGRVGRLLMNTLLMQEGYPPAVIRKEDRLDYITSLEQAQTTGNKTKFFELIYTAILRSYDMYLEAVNPEYKAVSINEDQLIKIGELADITSEKLSTLDFWTNNGLISVAKVTDGGYRLYTRSMAERVKEIRRLQNEKRLTIAEIKRELGGTING